MIMLPTYSTEGAFLAIIMVIIAIVLSAILIIKGNKEKKMIAKLTMVKVVAKKVVSTSSRSPKVIPLPDDSDVMYLLSIEAILENKRTIKQETRVSKDIYEVVEPGKVYPLEMLQPQKRE